jgi:ABC-type sugar transport system ATPase subunit
MDSDGLSVEGLTKRYGLATVVQSVSITAKPGEIVGLVGANGAGKSTLGRMIIGSEKPTAGRVLLDGEPIPYGNRKKAIRRGLQTVPQELDLAGRLRVWENLAIADVESPWVLRAGSRRAVTRRLLANVGESAVLADKFVNDVPFGQQQVVAIARALVGRARVVFFDEPTASLNATEAAAVLDLIRHVASAGAIVLFASHRIAEVLSVAGHVVVLRDGAVMLNCPRRGLTASDVEKAMFGSALSLVKVPPRPTSRTSSLAMTVSGLTVDGFVRDVSLQVRHGEVLGLYGLTGSGIGVLVRSLCGMFRATAGEVRVVTNHGEVAVRGIRQARKLGIGFLSMDRAHEGIYRDHSTSLNIVSELLMGRRQGGQLLSHQWLTSRAGVEAEVVGLEGTVEQLDRVANRLSGGQQQRVVIARRLAGGATIWVLDEPLGGIDIRSKEDISRLLRERAKAGEAVMMATGDPGDIAALCDRVIVLRAGEIAGEVDAVDANGVVEWSDSALGTITGLAVR